VVGVTVCVAIPCHVFIAPQMAQSLARSMHEYKDEISVRFFGNAVSTFGRNALVRWAKEVRATHVLWIDTDSVFPSDSVQRLIESGIPFIGANFALKDGSDRSAAWGIDGDRLKPRLEGIEEVGTLGFGLTMTSMEVLDAVGDPWFKTLEGETGGPADEFRFCQIARNAGFAPHVDHGLSRECAHVGLHPFRLPEVG
jgi:hypothetical protein